MEVIEPKAELLDYAKNSEENIAISARLSHSKNGLKDLDKSMTKEGKRKLNKKMIDLGHDSTLEHSFFFFRVICSRACSHQIVRHRIGTGFTQRSERYVDNEDISVIIPPEINDSPELREFFLEKVEDANMAYNILRDNGVKKEDARFILPRIGTELAFSMNGRALRHFIKLRNTPTAQWEIRKIAQDILKETKKIAPSIVAGL